MGTVDSVEGIVSPAVRAVEHQFLLLVKPDVPVDRVAEQFLGLADFLDLRHTQIINNRLTINP